MQGKKGKKKWIALGAVAAALAVLMTSTYLWFSANQQLENVFDMDLFDVRITENFNEDDPVTPGAEINKEVGVENKSSVKVAVRMQLKESLQLLDVDATGNPKIDYRSDKTMGIGEIPVTVSQSQIDHKIGTNGNAGSGFVADTTITNVPTGVKLYSRVTKTGSGTKTEYFAYSPENYGNRLVRYTPGTTAANGTFDYAYYIQKNPKIEGIHGKTNGDNDIDHNQISLNLKTGWEANWKLDATDGWYYYKTLLNEGQVSEYLVQSVSFAENLKNEYKGAVYTLTPVLSAIQAKDAAKDELWADAKDKIDIVDDTSIDLKF